MIHYNLICDQGHAFDGWFKDRESFNKQLSLGLICCSICNSTNVKKALSRPNIATSKDGETNLVKDVAHHKKAWQHVRQVIENNFENVGAEFAEEARKIHAGTAVERGIYGTSSADDIQSLTQEGIKVIPLPNHDKNSH